MPKYLVVMNIMNVILQNGGFGEYIYIYIPLKNILVVVKINDWVVW